MIASLKGRRTEIVKNKMTPEMKFFPDGKKNTYFPFNLQGSSCQCLYIHTQTHIYVYTHIYNISPCICIFMYVYMWFILPQGKPRTQNTAGQSRYC